jgi:hypothetical protein
MDFLLFCPIDKAYSLCYNKLKVQKMGWLILIILAVVAIPLIPVIARWLKFNHCPKCGGWFCLEFHDFVVTDKVVGHNRNRYGSGQMFRFLGLRFLSHSQSFDQPFIREWGEARYICKKCGRHVSFYNVTRDR